MAVSYTVSLKWQVVEKNKKNNNKMASSVKYVT